MQVSRRVSPPSSLVVIEDSSGGMTPDIGPELISATPSCIAVGTYCAADGETEIILTNEARLLPEGDVYQAMLTSPSRRVVVRTVHLETIAEMAVPAEVSTVGIWCSDAREPDRIVVLVQ